MLQSCLHAPVLAAYPPKLRDNLVVHVHELLMPVNALQKASEVKHTVGDA